MLMQEGITREKARTSTGKPEEGCLQGDEDAEEETVNMASTRMDQAKFEMLRPY